MTVLDVSSQMSSQTSPRQIHHAQDDTSYGKSNLMCLGILKEVTYPFPENLFPPGGLFRSISPDTRTAESLCGQWLLLFVVGLNTTAIPEARHQIGY